MCGIAGMVYRDGRPVDRGLVRRMGACLRHRGPDDEGEYTGGGAGIAHTRLSIIDLSESGRQPMRSDDGRYVVAYNGEVYNFRELRHTLERCGHEFRGRSDTEVVLRAFIEWGESSFAKLEGMFAMAVWDNAERRLHLVRDRFGIKPLYYHADAESLVFGSEIKALLASGEVGRDIDWRGLHEYLYYNTALGERTMFAGVRKLLPGHVLTLDDAGVRVEQYCSIFDVEAVEDDYATAVERVRELLERAVRDHLVSDVPVGVFLSGGIDSSAITAFAARHYGGRLKTFSAGFDFDRGVNELPKARKVAEHFGTDHHELHVSGGDVAGVIERLVRCHDQPFGDAANIPLFLLCEQLGDGNKVILQGDGGDEVFGGYKVHSLMAIERWATLFARATSWASPRVPDGVRYYGRDSAAQQPGPLPEVRHGDGGPPGRGAARPRLRAGSALDAGGERPVRALPRDVPDSPDWTGAAGAVHGLRHHPAGPVLREGRQGHHGARRGGAGAAGGHAAGGLRDGSAGEV